MLRSSRHLFEQQLNVILQLEAAAGCGCASLARECPLSSRHRGVVAAWHQVLASDVAVFREHAEASSVGW